MDKLIAHGMRAFAEAVADDPDHTSHVVLVETYRPATGDEKVFFVDPTRGPMTLVSRDLKPLRS